MREDIHDNVTNVLLRLNLTVSSLTLAATKITKIRPKSWKSLAFEIVEHSSHVVILCTHDTHFKITTWWINTLHQVYSFGCQHSSFLPKCKLLICGQLQKDSVNTEYLNFLCNKQNATFAKYFLGNYAFFWRETRPTTRKNSQFFTFFETFLHLQIFIQI